MGTKQSRRLKTEALLIEAVGTLLTRNGFEALGVNALAREAGVDKVLIYRYFDGLSGLYRAYGEKADFWPTLDEFLGPEPELLFQQPPPKVVGQILGNFAKAIQRRPLTLELLAREMTDRNTLTIALEEVREQRGIELGQYLATRNFHMEPQVMLAITMLSGGINYLSVRRRNIRVFGGVDIQNEETWNSLPDLIEAMVAGLYPETDP